MAYVVCESVLNDARPASFFDKLVELLHVCGKALMRLRLSPDQGDPIFRPIVLTLELRSSSGSGALALSN